PSICGRRDGNRSTLEVARGAEEMVSMADGDIEPVDQAVSSGDGEVAVVRSGGIVVLDGPQDVIDRLIAGDPALRTARQVRSNAPPAAGALDALASLIDLRGSAQTPGSMRSG